MGRRTFIICDDCQGEEFRLSEAGSQGWEAQCVACHFRFPLSRQDEDGATAPGRITWYADLNAALAASNHVQKDVVSKASRGKPCPPGCTCARHDRTRYTGNPNWAGEFDAKQELREQRDAKGKA